MTNIEMIHRLTTLAAELEKTVHAQTGRNSRDALAQLNRIRDLIYGYIDHALDENDAKYQSAMQKLADASAQLKAAEESIQKVAKAIAFVAKVLDLAEKVAKTAA